MNHETELINIFYSFSTNNKQMRNHCIQPHGFNADLVKWMMVKLPTITISKKGGDKQTINTSKGWHQQTETIVL